MLDLSNYWPKITGSKSRLGAYFRAKLGLQSCVEMTKMVLNGLTTKNQGLSSSSTTMASSGIVLPSSDGGGANTGGTGGGTSGANGRKSSLARKKSVNNNLTNEAAQTSQQLAQLGPCACLVDVPTLPSNYFPRPQLENQIIDGLIPSATSGSRNNAAKCVYLIDHVATSNHTKHGHGHAHTHAHADEVVCSGKSTLAASICRSANIAAHFDIAVWLNLKTMQVSPDVDKVLQKIVCVLAPRLGITSATMLLNTHQDASQLCQLIRYFSSSVSCRLLLVLDDVENQYLLGNLMSLGCSVLITTRLHSLVDNLTPQNNNSNTTRTVIPVPLMTDVELNGLMMKTLGSTDLSGSMNRNIVCLSRGCPMLASVLSYFKVFFPQIALNTNNKSRSPTRTPSTASSTSPVKLPTISALELMWTQLSPSLIFQCFVKVVMMFPLCCTAMPFDLVYGLIQHLLHKSLLSAHYGDSSDNVDASTVINVCHLAGLWQICEHTAGTADSTTLEPLVTVVVSKRVEISVRSWFWHQHQHQQQHGSDHDMAHAKKVVTLDVTAFKFMAEALVAYSASQQSTASDVGSFALHESQHNHRSVLSMWQHIGQLCSALSLTISEVDSVGRKPNKESKPGNKTSVKSNVSSDKHKANDTLVSPPLILELYDTTLSQSEGDCLALISSSTGEAAEVSTTTATLASRLFPRSSILQSANQRPEPTTSTPTTATNEVQVIKVLTNYVHKVKVCVLTVQQLIADYLMELELMNPSQRSSSNSNQALLAFWGAFIGPTTTNIDAVRIQLHRWVNAWVDRTYLMLASLLEQGTINSMDQLTLMFELSHSLGAGSSVRHNSKPQSFTHASGRDDAHTDLTISSQLIQEILGALMDSSSHDVRVFNYLTQYCIGCWSYVHTCVHTSRLLTSPGRYSRENLDGDCEFVRKAIKTLEECISVCTHYANLDTDSSSKNKFMCALKTTMSSKSKFTFSYFLFALPLQCSQLYASLGRIKESRSMLDKYLKYLEAFSECTGDDDDDYSKGKSGHQVNGLLWFVHAYRAFLSSLLRDNGQPKRAMKLLDKALSMCICDDGTKTITNSQYLNLSKSHPITIQTMHAIAQTMLAFEGSSAYPAATISSLMNEAMHLSSSTGELCIESMPFLERVMCACRVCLCTHDSVIAKDSSSSLAIALLTHYLTALHNLIEVIYRSRHMRKELLQSSHMHSNHAHTLAQKITQNNGESHPSEAVWLPSSFTCDHWDDYIQYRLVKLVASFVSRMLFGLYIHIGDVSNARTVLTRAHMMHCRDCVDDVRVQTLFTTHGIFAPYRELREIHACFVDLYRHTGTSAGSHDCNHLIDALMCQCGVHEHYTHMLKAASSSSAVPCVLEQEFEYIHLLKQLAETLIAAAVTEDTKSRCRQAESILIQLLYRLEVIELKYGRCDHSGLFHQNISAMRIELLESLSSLSHELKDSCFSDGLNYRVAAAALFICAFRERAAKSGSDNGVEESKNSSLIAGAGPIVSLDLSGCQSELLSLVNVSSQIPDYALDGTNQGITSEMLMLNRRCVMNQFDDLVDGMLYSLEECDDRRLEFLEGKIAEFLEDSRPPKNSTSVDDRVEAYDDLFW
jgi:hypothetical protein